MKYRIDYERRSGEDVYEETDHDIEAESAGEALERFIAELTSCDLDGDAKEELTLVEPKDIHGPVTMRELITKFVIAAGPLEFWVGEDAIYRINFVEVEDGRECSRCHGKGRVKLEAPVVTVAQLRKHLQRCAASLHHAVAYVTVIAPDGQHNAGIWATAANEALALLHDPSPAAPGSTWAEQEPCGCCSTCSCGKS